MVFVEVRWSDVERPAKTLRRRQHLGMATATEVTDSGADLVDFLEGAGVPGLRVKNPGQSFAKAFVAGDPSGVSGPRTSASQTPMSQAEGWARNRATPRPSRADDLH